MMKLDDITQFFRPICTPVQNVSSYYLYKFKNLTIIDKAVKIFKIFTFISLIVTTVGKFLDLLPILRDETFSSFIHKGWLISLVSFFLSHISQFKDFVFSYEKRFTYEKKNQELYSNVQPQDANWTWKDILMKDGSVERIFYNDSLNGLLLSDKNIAMKRNKRYEKALRAKITNNTENYYLFLKHNYRRSMYEGKQFYNEKKYGLSEDIIPVPSAGSVTAYVHKTCYFDTYLTNIIPNSVLHENKTGEAVVDFSSMQDSGKFMPFDSYEEGNVLRKLSEAHPMANELGISTLLIQKEYIQLWKQNRLAQSSAEKIVATGSGSADWNDCKKYFGSANGFRESVIYSMNRELWEESNNMRSVHKKEFMDAVDTRITGYFRWLNKAGKSEFVGISRLRGEYELTPEQSEVVSYDSGKIRVRNIKQLMQIIDNNILSDNKNGDYSLPCIMAFCGLKQACELYCKDKCQNDPSHCTECHAVPYDVLFE